MILSKSDQKYISNIFNQLPLSRQRNIKLLAQLYDTTPIKYLYDEIREIQLEKETCNYLDYDCDPKICDQYNSKYMCPCDIIGKYDYKQINQFNIDAQSNNLEDERGE